VPAGCVSQLIDQTAAVGSGQLLQVGKYVNRQLGRQLPISLSQSRHRYTSFPSSSQKILGHGNEFRVILLIYPGTIPIIITWNEQDRSTTETGQ
jgi:hypothetical protein